ncbi:MAG: DUF1573 domain-containing protein [Chitinophagaceae bacterium]
MKYLLICLTWLLVCTSIQAQTAQPKPASTISFVKTEHNFGKIKKDKPVTYVFTLKNNGNKPLLIENATAECGCTTPEYSKAAILKGKTSPIKVTFNANAEGVFNKRVTVKFLNVNEPTILLIKGEVVK